MDPNRINIVKAWHGVLDYAPPAASAQPVVAPPSDVCPRCAGLGVVRDFTQLDPATGRYGYPELCRVREGGCGGTGRVGG